MMQSYFHQNSIANINVDSIPHMIYLFFTHKNLSESKPSELNAKIRSSTAMWEFSVKAKFIHECFKTFAMHCPFIAAQTKIFFFFLSKLPIPYLFWTNLHFYNNSYVKKATILIIKRIIIRYFLGFSHVFEKVKYINIWK